MTGLAPYLPVSAGLVPAACKAALHLHVHSAFLEMLCHLQVDDHV